MKGLVIQIKNSNFYSSWTFFTNFEYPSKTTAKKEFKYYVTF